MAQRNRSKRLLAVSFICFLIGAAPMIAGAEDAAPDTQAPAPTSLVIADQQKSPDEHQEEDRAYPLHVDDHGVFELTYSVAGKYEDPVTGNIRVKSGNNQLYLYYPSSAIPLNLFFPVLDGGDYEIALHMTKVKVGRAFNLNLHRFEVTVTDAMKSDAAAAVARGMAFLEKGNDSVDWESEDLTDCESLVALAYVAGKDPQDRRFVEGKYLPAIAKDFKESDPEIWNGHSVHGLLIDQFGYRHALATLALAEIAATYQNQQAKSLASQGAECLLAAQLTVNKSPKWNGPIKTDNIGYGGWRYTFDSTDADLSVTGWCTIALVATANAKIEVPGLRDSLLLASQFVRRMGDGKGYGYTNPNGGELSDIHVSIGTLILKLYGENSPDIESAGQYLDGHLGPGIQCDNGENYPLYYAYYATRANYLRGGFAWEAWRSTMIKQLLNHQCPDGSWKQFGSESGRGPRYGAAMATMILRMCLNDVPDYLKQEVRGF